MADRILLIVESPNKVKTIKQFLPSNYIVMASVGHITKIEDNNKSYYNTGIYPENNFKINYKLSEDKKEIVEKLKEQVELATLVYLASDPDREGEAISWALKEFLKIPDKKYRRVTFHEITKNAVLKALENPRKIDKELVDAAQSRQCLDKMIGYRLSPISRRKLGAKSVGRCQSAGLKILVDREEEINNFIPKEYGDLFLNFNKNNTLFKAKYFGEFKEIKQPSIKHCEEVINDCKNKDFIVIDYETKDRISKPKLPFTTSTFQQEVANKLNISVKKSMEIAQKLFEGIDVNGQHLALITYIRTDSAELAPEFIPLLEKYIKDNYGIKYFAEIKKQKKKENVQDGHEAIRPVDLNMTPELLSNYVKDRNLIKVYEIIYKRTIAASMASSITAETIYTINCKNHTFKLSSKELKFDGYLKVYNYKEQDDEELIKVTLDKNEIIDKSYSPNLELIKKQTLPPARYKEATFIKELESTGIGRPSTFATIVETLLDSSRGYCELVDNVMIPTQKGIELSHFLTKAFPKLININYTSELEKDLDLIATGKLNRLDFLNTFYNNLEQNVKESKNIDTPKKEHVIGEDACPICGAKMYLREGKFGQFYGCSKYPYCKGIIQINKK